MPSTGGPRRAASHPLHPCPSNPMTTPESTTAATTATVSATQTDTAVVTLDTPIQRGEQTISSVTLPKFDVGNLDPVDLVALGGEVLAFLLPKGQVQDFLNA